MTDLKPDDPAQENRGSISPIETFLSAAEGLEAISSIVSQIVGEPCWSCAAMEITGSALSFHFGARVPWTNSRGGKTLFHGTFGLMVEGAAWRVLRGRECVMTSDTKMTEARAGALASATNSTVASASVSEATFDLQITLQSGVRIDVFCNCCDEEIDNYTLSHTDNYYAIGFKSGCQMVRLETNG